MHLAGPLVVYRLIAGVPPDVLQDHEVHQIDRLELVAPPFLMWHAHSAHGLALQIPLGALPVLYVLVQLNPTVALPQDVVHANDPALYVREARVFPTNDEIVLWTARQAHAFGRAGRVELRAAHEVHVKDVGLVAYAGVDAAHTAVAVNVLEKYLLGVARGYGCNCSPGINFLHINMGVV